ncbi:MAG: hypothetical protein RQ847_04385 [Wenzhouxiangellaceae bacterium]|nr:hypothetical protein [Wenzhouxiangellaceae bacterium]
MKTWAGVLALMMLSACMNPRPTQNTLPKVFYPASAGHAADTLLIMLPGIHDGVQDFKLNGLVDLVRAQQPHWDMVAVDAHFGYYRERSIIDRLREDVVLPARANGYRHIWLSGPSLGGFGGLLYACRQTEDHIDGIIAIAPYLGERPIIKDIERAGGPADWQASDAGENIERELWTCLRDGIKAEVWLGWGTEDRMGRGNRLLAESLPPEHIFMLPGSHRWDGWIELWADILPVIGNSD